MDIRNNESESRYEAVIDGQVAFSEYDMEGPELVVFTHTVVPDALAGRGIAGQIVKYALDDVRARGWKVVPQCAYVAAYIERHPEYRDLIETNR